MLAGHDYVPLGKDGDDELAVTCWCEKAIVVVPKRFVRESLTGSCGRDGCDWLTMRMRAA